VETPVWIWAAFVAGILALLTVDLVLVQRRPHGLGAREAGVQTAYWIGLGVAFAGLVFAWRGGEAAGEYLSGYLIEKSLSADNVFVWALIFAHFSVPLAFQHRALFWGVMGALVMRGLFIFGGVTLLDRFDWVIYVFGAFLLLTAVRLVSRDDGKIDPNRHPLGRFIRERQVSMGELDEPRFLVRREGRIVATALFGVLLLIETTDLVFAVDSIPAVLAVSRDPFIVFSSNVFAILGLRAMYFLLAALNARFANLQQGMAVVLGFVGVKMLLTDVVHIPVGISLAVIATVLTVSMLSSLRSRQIAELQRHLLQEQRHQHEDRAHPRHADRA